MNWSEIQPYLLSLGIGLLLGLQREAGKSHRAGIRTFALIALLGSASASMGSWQTCAALIAVAAIMVVSDLQPDKPDGAGFTTEIACLMTFFIGALFASGSTHLAVLLSGCTLVLLQAKKVLHSFSNRLDAEDLKAIAQLGLLGLVILPLLPNESYGPYDALNPFKIWLMVVVIVGLSLAAYFVSKFVGQKKGTLSAGVLGGLISSTATTASFARRGKAEGAMSVNIIALVIMIASTIVFARVLLEVVVVAPGRWAEMVYPLVAMMVWMTVVSFGLYRFTKIDPPETEEEDPPTELKGAVIFGLLYGVVLILVAWAHDYFGDEGVYVVAFISGLTDMDAITLSSAKMVTDDVISSGTAWRSIMIGGMANLIFKGGIAFVLGPVGLRKPLSIAFLASILGGVGILWFWP